NDVLVTVLGALCILVAVTGKWSWRRAVLLGALFGAALLTKTSAVGVAPALGIALLQTRRDGGVRPLLIAGAVAAACVLSWLASNVAIYGELITTREQLAMAAFPPRTIDPGFWSVSTLHAFVTFWTGDPFLSMPGAVALAIVAAFICALAVAGLWRARRPSCRPPGVVRPGGDIPGPRRVAGGVRPGRRGRPPGPGALLQRRDRAGRVDPDRRVARRRRARGDLRLQPLDPFPPGVRAGPLVRRVALLRPAQGRRRGPRRLFQKPGRRRLYHDRRP